MSFNHYMLDIETLGNCANGAVVTMGVVPFDPAQGKVDDADTFYRRVDLKDPALGVIEAGNVAWWMTQDAAVREEALGASPEGADRQMATQIPDSGWPSSYRRPLKVALLELATWLSTRGMKIMEDGPWRLWAKPPEFDVRLLRDAHERVGLSFPFHYRATRDMRTLFEVAQSLGLERGEPEAGNAQKHNALEDARWQAHVVCAVYQELRRKVMQ